MIEAQISPTHKSAYLPMGTPVERKASRASDVDTLRLDAMGVHVTSASQLVKVLRQMGTRNASGARTGPIFLHPGRYFFRDGLTVSSDYTDLIALSPGNTVFRREAAGTSALVTLSGQGCRIQGVTFQDTATTAQYAVKLSGLYSEAMACIFDDCWRAIHVTGNGCKVAENLVKSSRDTTYSVYLEGNDPLVQCNRVLGAAAGATEIYAADASLRGVYVANHCALTGAISYLAGSLSVGDATMNYATVTAR